MRCSAAASCPITRNEDDDRHAPPASPSPHPCAARAGRAFALGLCQPRRQGAALFAHARFRCRPGRRGGALGGRGTDADDPDPGCAAKAAHHAHPGAAGRCERRLCQRRPVGRGAAAPVPAAPVGNRCGKDPACRARRGPVSDRTGRTACQPAARIRRRCAHQRSGRLAPGLSRIASFGFPACASRTSPPDERTRAWDGSSWQSPFSPKFAGHSA